MPLAPPLRASYGPATPDHAPDTFMRFALCLIALLGACAEFPALDGTVAPEVTAGEYPALVPLDPLLARAGAPDNSRAAGAEAALAPRIAALRARAARLRGPVIPAPIRARMVQGVR